MNYLKYLVEEIPTTVIATVDDISQPVTSAIDITGCTDQSLLFIVEKNKGLYNRLKLQRVLSLTGIKQNSPTESHIITIRGMAQDIGSELVAKLIQDNPYMKDLFPTKNSQDLLTVFEIFDGIGEYIYLNKDKVVKDNFNFQKYKID